MPMLPGPCGIYAVPKPRRLIPVLTELLADKDVKVRWIGARILGMIGGPDAKAAVPALIVLLKEKDAGDSGSDHPSAGKHWSRG